MPSRGRHLARRYLPHRVRAAGSSWSASRRRRSRRSAKRTKPAKRPRRSRRGARSPRPAGRSRRSRRRYARVEVLRRGGTLAEALVAEVRRLLADQQRGAANAVATALLAESQR